MGAVGSNLGPVLDRYADTLTRVQYAVRASVRNFKHAIAELNLDSANEAVSSLVVNVLAAPSYNQIETIRHFFQKPIVIQKSMNDLDAPLTRILTAAIDDGTKCIQDLGLSASSSLYMRASILATTRANVSTFYSIYIST